MTVYILLLLAIIIIWIPALVTERGQRTALYLSFFIMFLIMGLRAPSIGSDTPFYVDSYSRVGRGPFLNVFVLENSAPVYNLLAWLLYRVFPDGQMLLVFCSLIICAGYAYFIDQMCDAPFRATLLFLGTNAFFASMNLMRQYLAIAVLLVGVVAFQKHGRRFLGTVLALLAIGIHSIVLISLLVLIPVLRREDPERPVVLGPLYEPLSRLFSKVFTHFEMYTSPTSDLTIESENSGRLSYVYYGYALLFVLSLHNTKALKEYFGDPGKLSCFIGAAAMAIFSFSFSGSLLLSRMLFNFEPFYSVYIADASRELDRDAHTVLYGLIVVCGLSVHAALMLYFGHNHVLPYRFFFS